MVLFQEAYTYLATLSIISAVTMFCRTTTGFYKNIFLIAVLMHGACY